MRAEPVFVSTPTSAPHQGPRTMAEMAVPIMSRYTGSRSAVAMYPPTMFNATLTGMSVTMRVIGRLLRLSLLFFRVGAVAASDIVLMPFGYGLGLGRLCRPW